MGKAKIAITIERMQKAAKAAGLDSMTLDQIERITKNVRRKRAHRT